MNLEELVADYMCHEVTLEIICEVGFAYGPSFNDDYSKIATAMGTLRIKIGEIREFQNNLSKMVKAYADHKA